MPFGFSFEKNLLSNFLKGASYPASKQQLIDLAVQKDEPPQVLSMLQSLPDRQFSNAEEAQSELKAAA